MSDLQRDSAPGGPAGDDDAQRRRVGRGARVLAIFVLVLLAIGACTQPCSVPGSTTSCPDATCGAATFT